MVFKIIGSLRNIRSGNFSPHGQHRVNLKNLRQGRLTHRHMCPILGLSEAGVSQLFRVTSAIPDDIIYSIGRAKAVGRPKWTALADLLKDGDGSISRARAVKDDTEFRSADGQGRIALLLRALTPKQPAKMDEEISNPIEITDGQRVFGQAKRTPKGFSVSIAKEEAAFAHWLVARLPDLVREFRAGSVQQARSE